MSYKWLFGPGAGLGLLLLIAGLSACEADADRPPAAEPAEAGTEAANVLSDAEREAGWQLLFDGQSLDGWRGFKRSDVPSGWVVEDGVVHLTGEGDGGDLITAEPYENYELAFDWKVAPGGNSGVMYKVQEGDQFENTHNTGPEYQVIDDEGYPAELKEVQKSAANYDLHAPEKRVAKPAGEWNQARIVVNGAHVEHWLNGEKVVEYELWSDDWKARVAQSKFTQWPDYGMAKAGHIALQDHGDEVWYRNIKIRPL